MSNVVRFPSKSVCLGWREALEYFLLYKRGEGTPFPSWWPSCMLPPWCAGFRPWFQSSTSPCLPPSGDNFSGEIVDPSSRFFREATNPFRIDFR